MRIRTLFIIFILLSVLLYACNDTKGLTKEDVHQLISKEVPIGTDISKVITYLKAKKIDYGVSDNKKTITSMFRNVSRDIFIIKSIEVKFIFNDENKLIKYEFKDVLTGP